MKNIIKAIREAKKVALFTHITPDGDAIGSTFAMGQLLRSAGIENDIYINEKVPERLKVLEAYGENPYYTELQDNDYDLMLALDCGDLHRLGDFADAFGNFENTAVIDHHVSNPGYAKVNFIEAHGSSTGEAVYNFALQGCFEISSNVASLLYAAITSDTGCFKYSSTTPRTLVAAADLMEKGADYVKICKKLFDTEDIKTLRLKAMATENLQLYHNGKVAVITVTTKDLESHGAIYEDAEGLTDIPRSVSGVEVGIVIKEWKDKTKASIRTNEYVDASALAAIYGGGGHIRAAGLVSEMDVLSLRDDLVANLKDLI
ncbi:MAG: bifunctional oligoribonuclease/PAP phosphatase NrnA [Clostridia bacterium]|nr:bifunctional oligoribonuclease/PAP phosphatase NrnA [Clostridia bacterium]